MAYRITRLPQEQLTEDAIYRATDEQKAMLEKLFAMGWKVKGTYSLPRAERLCHLITLDQKGCIAALYPDGKLARNTAKQKSIKLNTNWAQPGDWTF